MTRQLDCKRCPHIIFSVQTERGSTNIGIGTVVAGKCSEQKGGWRADCDHIYPYEEEANSKKNGTLSPGAGPD